MNIYVGNLSLETTEDELRREFNRFGDVISVIVMNDRYIGSGQPRGYAYVEMGSKSEGNAAIASLEGKMMGDRIVNVVESLPVSDKSGGDTRAVKKNHRSFRKRGRIFQYF